jgi:hypothetical protein
MSTTHSESCQTLEVLTPALQDGTSRVQRPNDGKRLMRLSLNFYEVVIFSRVFGARSARLLRYRYSADNKRRI